jgi:hypothetical protein
VIETEFGVNPPGLRGLNRLAKKLKALVVNHNISNWHLGHWSDKTKTRHGILFESDRDATAAKDHCRA